MSLEKEEKIAAAFNFIKNKFNDDSRMQVFSFTWNELEDILNEYNDQQTEKLREENKKPVLCPKCNGQGIVSKPPYVAGDVHECSSTSATHTCDVCNGTKILYPLSLELQQTKEKLKRCEEVIEKIIRLEDRYGMYRSIDECKDVYEVLEIFSQLKDNG